jgi:hypothetical protein
VPVADTRSLYRSYNKREIAAFDMILILDAGTSATLANLIQTIQP